MQNLIATLSVRQSEIYDLVCKGYSNKEIAQALMITTAGVKWHMTNIFSCLGVSSRAEAIIYGQGSREIDFPQVGNGEQWTENDIRQAALKLVELGLGTKKDVNETVINLLGVLAGKIK